MERLVSVTTDLAIEMLPAVKVPIATAPCLPGARTGRQMSHRVCMQAQQSSELYYSEWQNIEQGQTVLVSLVRLCVLS
jgi:hypothetical protein